MSAPHGHTNFEEWQGRPGGFTPGYGFLPAGAHGSFGTQQKAAQDDAELSFYERNQQAIQCGLAGFVGGLALGALLVYRNGKKK